MQVVVKIECEIRTVEEYLNLDAASLQETLWLMATNMGIPRFKVSTTVEHPSKDDVGCTLPADHTK